MKSFETDLVARQALPQKLVQTIRLIGEYKGKEDLFRAQTPEVLENLRQSAVIQSTESSNRIEGVTAPPERIRQIVAEHDMPRNRSEQEIAGYRDVLNTIHANFEHIPLTAGMVRQLHKELFQFLPSGGGNWKSTDNEITETGPDGKRVIRFRPVPAFRTAEAMLELHAHFTRQWNSTEAEPLVLIAAYVLDFLCIHPFLDGNGRLARLLTLLLLYKAGYEVGRYISLERLVERTRESYYDSLYASSQGWHEGKHDLIPWTEYLLGVVVLAAYRDFEQRVGFSTSARGAKGQLVRDAIARLPKRFRYADVERLSPGVSRPTIRRVLAELQEQELVACLTRGRAAVWEKRDHGVGA